MIPKELRNLKQWTYSFSRTELKRPTYTKYLPNGALNMRAAQHRAGKDKYIGFYPTLEDPYVLLDIDHVDNPSMPFEELPLPLAVLLQSNNTYSEISPSGHGIRVIFRLPLATEKEKLDGHVFYIKNADGDKRNAQMSIWKPWNTITLNQTPFSVDTVGEVSLGDLEEVFDIRHKGYVKTPHVEARKTSSELPPFGEVCRALGGIRLDQNPRIRRAYEQIFMHTYQHYDFWVRVLMGMHNYGEITNKSTECLEASINWSREDVGFQSEEDVTKHWRSFSEKPNEVSYKSVFGLYYKSNIKWPVPKKQTKSEKEHNQLPLPLNTEYVNFETLLNFYNLKLYRDQTDHNKVFITGDEDIIREHFMLYNVQSHYDKYYGPLSFNTLTPAFHMFCQQMGFLGIGHSQISSFVANSLAVSKLEVNLFKIFFDTPFDELPPKYKENANFYDESTMEFLFNCMTIEYQTEEVAEELSLYKRYYESWWMGMIRNLYFMDERHTNNCVLLLTGREQIRKTSHFKYLLPSFFRDQIAFTTHGFANESSVRDVSKLSASNLMIVWDELEQYLTALTESNFKKIIDNNRQTIIDKYQVLPQVIKPMAIYGATSNKREFKLGHDGSRRLFHIPVSWVDTDSIMKINWHKLINDVIKKVKAAVAVGEIPWLLSEDELEQQTSLHRGITSLNALDIALSELYSTEDLEPGATVVPGLKSLQLDKTGRALTTKEVADVLVRYDIPVNTISRPGLIKALERLCGNYTRTRRKAKNFHSPRCSVYKGLATQSSKTRWVMPPMRPNALESLFYMFKQKGE